MMALIAIRIEVMVVMMIFIVLASDHKSVPSFCNDINMLRAVRLG